MRARVSAGGRASLALRIAALLTALAGALAFAAPAAAEDVFISVYSDGFSRAEVELRPGDQVHWRNQTGETIEIASAGGVFDSGAVPDDGGFSVDLSVPGMHLYAATGDGIDLLGLLDVGMTRLGGPADAPAEDHIPDLPFEEPPPGDIELHPEFGLLVSRSRILVAFSESATVSEANAALAAAGTTIIGGLPKSRLLLVKGPEGEFDERWFYDTGFESLEFALEKLNASAAIEAASMSPVVTPDAVPTNTKGPIQAAPNCVTGCDWHWFVSAGPGDGPYGFGGNWGLEASRVPQAWNLVDAIRGRGTTVGTGLVDSGFFAGHEDLSRLQTPPMCRGTTCATSSLGGAHGTSVAGIIGADYANRSGPDAIGISGINPFTNMVGVPNGFGGDGTFAGTAAVFEMLLDEAEPHNVRVINYSMGFEPLLEGAPKWPQKWWDEHPDRWCGPASDDDRKPESHDWCTYNNEDGWLQSMVGMGTVARKVAERAAALPQPVIIVASAGNVSSTFCSDLDRQPCPGFAGPPARIEAQNSTPWGWAARHWNGAVSSNPILIVEALGDNQRGGPSLARAGYSNVEGDLSAPGEQGAAPGTSPSGYRFFNGTSMAAPMVTGVVGYMLAYKPQLTIAEVREHLLRWARDDTQGHVTPRLDAFASLMSVPGAARDLVDFNDRSVDGNRRVLLGEGNYEISADQASAAPDGNVDMRDFRRLRDAWLQSCSLVLADQCPAAGIELDGDQRASKKDLNLDGCVSLSSTDVDDPLCDTSETDYSRYDFNGDGFVRALDPQNFPLNASGGPVSPPGVPLTDLQVLRSQWGGPSAQTEGWLASDLESKGLLRSGDIEVRLRDFFKAGAKEVDVQMRRIGGGPALPDRHAGEGDYIVATVPIQGEGPSRFEVSASATVNGTKLEAAPQEVELRFGEDKRVDLCVAHLELTGSKALRADGKSRSEIVATFKGCKGDQLAGRNVLFLLTPNGQGHATVAPATATTGPDGKAKTVITSGTEAVPYTLKAILGLGEGHVLTATIRLEVRPPLRIAYVFRQTNAEWSEGGPSGATTRWGLVPGTPDCVGAGIQYCVDKFNIDLDGSSTPTRVGTLSGLGSSFKLSEEVQNGIGASSSSWTLSDPVGSNSRTGSAKVAWGVLDPRHYQDFDLGGKVSAEETDDGLVVKGLDAVGELGYEHYLVEQAHTGPRPDPIELHDARYELMFVPRGDGSALRFAADTKAPLVFRRAVGGGLKPYGFCGTFTTDLTTQPGYLRVSGSDWIPWAIDLTRDPVYTPGSRPMPVGPGHMKITYAFGAVASYGDASPVPALPDCVENHAPEPDFRFQPSSPSEGRVVYFTNLSTDPENDIVRWQWEFGDGTTSPGAEPHHLYDDNGTYTVTLTAFDGKGLSASATKTVVVENLPPDVELDDAAAQVGEPLHVRLRAVDPGKVDKQQLRLQLTSTDPAFPTMDRTASSGAESFTVTGLGAGTYPLTVTVTDKDGASAKAKATAIVSPVPLPPPPPPPPPFATCNTNVTLDAEEASFLDLVNDYRALNALPPVGASPTLTKAAETHAQDMADNDFFSHTGSDGSTPFERAMRAKYPGKGVGENIAAGMADGAGALFAWRASITGHNEQMLDPRWRSVGISRVNGSKWYWATSYGDELDCVPPPALQAFGSVDEPAAPPEWPPTPALAVSTDQPLQGAPVSFVNRSRDANGLPLAATLDLGDGSPAVALGPDETHEHTYRRSDGITAKLTTVDSAGQTADVRHNLFIRPPPSPQLEYLGDTTGVVGGTATLKARARAPGTGQPIAGLPIDFEIQGIAGQTATATTGADGIAEVSLRLDAEPGFYWMSAFFAGDQQYGSRIVYAQIRVVRNAAPVADTGGPYPLGLGDELLLSGGGSHDPDTDDQIAAYDWDLNGDGTYGDVTGATPGVLAWAEVQTLVCGGTCAAGISYPIGLRVRDTRGATGIASSTVSFVEDFGLFVTPPEKRIVPGGTNYFTVSVVGGGGFSTPVTLSAPDLPAGVTASFSPNPVTPTGVSTMTVTAAPDIEGGGSFPLKVVGDANGLLRETTDEVEVVFGLIPICQGSLTGVVTSSETGDPIEGAYVTTGEWPNQRSTSTDASGRYGISNLPVGPGNQPVFYQTGISKPDHWPRYPLTSLVRCGATTRLDAALTPVKPSPLSGRVVVGIPDPLDHSYTRGVTPTNEPIPGVAVTGWDDFGVTDADGRYSGNSRLNPENYPFTQGVAAFKLGYWRVEKTHTAEADVAKQLDFALVPVCYGKFHGGTVRYRVNGQPVQGAQVDIHGAGFRVTGADGRYSIEGLVPLGFNNSAATYEASVSPGPLAPPGSQGERKTYTLGDCGAEASLDFLIDTPAINEATIEGYVTDEETGAPLADAFVYVQDLQSFVTDRTDAEGFYRLEHVIVGYGTTTTAYLGINGSLTGYWSTQPFQIITAGQTSRIDLQLLRMRTGSIQGLVTDRVTGAPIEGVFIDSQFSRVGRTGADGRYGSTVALGPRNAPVSMSLRTFCCQTDPVHYWPEFKNVIVDGTTPATADFQLLRQCEPARIVGVVLNAATQQPISGASVEAHGVRQTNTNDAGRFELWGIPLSGNRPWQVQVSASAPGFFSQTKSVTVFCGATIVLDFGKPQTKLSTVTGTVRNVVTSEPIAGAFVGSEWGAATTTAADGTYRLTGAPLGNGNADRVWKVTAAPDGFTARTKPVTVKADLESTLDFEFGLPDNRAPVAHDATAAATEDTPAAVLLTGDDPDGDPVELNVVTQPAHGTLAGTPPALTYVPEADFHGPDSFTFTASDGELASEPATISIVVAPANDAPTCAPVGADGDEDTELSGSFVCNDVDGDALTYRVAEAAGHGSVTPGSGDGFTYTPAADFNGDDAFTYVASDGAAESAAASGDLTVRPLNDAPSAGAGSFAVDVHPGSVAVDLGALAEDVETPDSGLAYTVVSAPRKGSLSGSGAVREYRPAEGALGIDTFAFRVTDLGDPDGCSQAVGCDSPEQSAPATVTVRIVSENRPPTVTLSAPDRTGEGGAPVRLIAEATDPDDDPLTYVWSSTAGALDASGSSATFSQDDGPAQPVVRVTVSDGSTSTSAERTITVDNVSPAAEAGPDLGVYWGRPLALAATAAEPSAADRAAGLDPAWRFDDGDGTTTGLEATHVYAAPGEYEALFAASDKDGGIGVDAVRVVVQRRPTAIAYTGPSSVETAQPILSARLSDTVDSASADLGGRAIVFAIKDGPTVTAITDAAGVASAEVGQLQRRTNELRVSFAADGRYERSASLATVVLTGLNLAPASLDDEAATDEDIVLSLPAADVLDNDADPDGDVLGVSSVTATADTHGSVTLEGATIAYAPSANYHGLASFGYSVSDGYGGTASATVRVTVRPVNDAPTVTLAAPAAVDEGAAPVPLVATGADIDGDALSYSWTDQVVGSGATATFAADDGPSAALVRVAVSDGIASGTAERTITVRNAPPSADAGPARTAPWGVPVALSGSATDPSAADRAAGLNPLWDFGDGSPHGGGLAVEHAYDAPGAYVAGLTVTDKDGGSARDTTAVEVGRRASRLAYTGVDLLSARLVDAIDVSTARLAGRTVVFEVQGQFVSAQTDGAGLATAALALPPGTHIVTARLAEDDLYFASDAQGTLVVQPSPPPPPPPPPREVRVDGVRCSIVGTPGPDVLRGTSRDDVLCGLAGNDRIYGLAGDDRAYGGAGADLVVGGPGRDLLRGSAGRDTVLGGAGNDRLDGGLGSDRVDGGAGDDIVNGLAGDDTLVGGAGNDKLGGTAGNDRLSGGLGNDFLSGGGGNDLLRGEAGADALRGGSGRDRAYGGAGDDDLGAGPGAGNVLRGETGADDLDARNGERDDVDGGPGRDHALVDGVLDFVHFVEDILRR